MADPTSNNAGLTLEGLDVEGPEASLVAGLHDCFDTNGLSVSCGLVSIRERGVPFFTNLEVRT